MWQDETRRGETRHGDMRARGQGQGAQLELELIDKILTSMWAAHESSVAVTVRVVGL